MARKIQRAGARTSTGPALAIPMAPGSSPSDRPVAGWASNADPSLAPLALILSGGGARAAYQVGVLAAIAEQVPDLKFPILTGVSAGAINIAFLAAHRGSLAEAVAGLRREWARLTIEQVYVLRPPGVWRGFSRWVGHIFLRNPKSQAAIRGLLDLRPLKAFLEKSIDFEGINANIKSGHLRAVALSATSYATGSTVSFVQAGSEAPGWERFQRYAVFSQLRLEHVMASSAIPILFPAVKLEDGFYGDGSVRQWAPFSPAIHLGAGRLLTIGMRATPPSRTLVRPMGEYPTAVEVLGLLLHSIFLDSLDADIERLDVINRLLAAIPSGAPIPYALRPVELLTVRPSRDLGAMASGHAHRLPRSVRWIVRALGGGPGTGSDFLSYLLFDPVYTGTLTDLGYEDGRAQWGKIEAFLAGSKPGPDPVVG